MATDASRSPASDLADKIKRHERINELRTEHGMEPLPEQLPVVKEEEEEEGVGHLLAQHQDLNEDYHIMLRVQTYLRDLLDLMRLPSISAVEKKRQHDHLIHLIGDFDSVVEATSTALTDLEYQIEELGGDPQEE